MRAWLLTVAVTIVRGQLRELGVSAGVAPCRRRVRSGVHRQGVWQAGPPPRSPRPPLPHRRSGIRELTVDLPLGWKVEDWAMEITRDEVRRLVEAGAQLVEVLPRDEFDDEHLPGAISLPLKSLTAGTSAVLDRSRPVIVYCWDGL